MVKQWCLRMYIECVQFATVLVKSESKCILTLIWLSTDSIILMLYVGNSLNEWKFGKVIWNFHTENILNGWNIHSLVTFLCCLNRKFTYAGYVLEGQSFGTTLSWHAGQENLLTKDVLSKCHSTWEETVMTWFETLPSYLPGGAYGKHENSLNWSLCQDLNLGPPKHKTNYLIMTGGTFNVAVVIR